MSNRTKDLFLLSSSDTQNPIWTAGTPFICNLTPKRISFPRITGLYIAYEKSLSESTCLTISHELLPETVWNVLPLGFTSTLRRLLATNASAHWDEYREHTMWNIHEKWSINVMPLPKDGTCEVTVFGRSFCCLLLETAWGWFLIKQTECDKSFCPFSPLHSHFDSFPSSPLREDAMSFHFYDSQLHLVSTSYSALSTSDSRHHCQTRVVQFIEIVVQGDVHNTSGYHSPETDPHFHTLLRSFCSPAQIHPADFFDLNAHFKQTSGVSCQIQTTRRSKRSCEPSYAIKSWANALHHITDAVRSVHHILTCHASNARLVQ